MMMMMMMMMTMMMRVIMMMIMVVTFPSWPASTSTPVVLASVFKSNCASEISHSWSLSRQNKFRLQEIKS